MAVIKKKTWPELFEAVASGKKKFDLRLNDFEVDEGDTLLLEEYDPTKKEYTGRSAEKKVGYVFRFKPTELSFYSKEDIERDGLQIISLE